ELPTSFAKGPDRRLAWPGQASQARGLPCVRTSPTGLPPWTAFLIRRRPFWTGFGMRSGKRTRSEEHTSELQSRGHLVCRLLLEKKKNRRFCKASADKAYTCC